MSSTSEQERWDAKTEFEKELYTMDQFRKILDRLDAETGRRILNYVQASYGARYIQEDMRKLSGNPEISVPDNGVPAVSVTNI